MGDIRPNSTHNSLVEQWIQRYDQRHRYRRDEFGAGHLRLRWPGHRRRGSYTHIVGHHLLPDAADSPPQKRQEGPLNRGRHLSQKVAKPRGQRARELCAGTAKEFYAGATRKFHEFRVATADTDVEPSFGDRS